MLKRLLIITTLFFTSCFTAQELQASEIVVGSGKIKKETRNVVNFKKVIISGSGNLQIKQSDREDLKIKADDNILPLILSEVKGNTLYLGPKNKKRNLIQKSRYFTF